MVHGGATLAPTMAIRGPTAVQGDEPSPPTGRVAVIMRTKDRPLLLDRALRTVMQQTHHDLHLVIVNDGGQPEPVEEVLARRSAACRGRASVVHNPTSGGMEAAANIGVANSDEPFLALLDDDDTWHPRFLEATTSALHATGVMGVVTKTMICIERVNLGDIRTLGWMHFGRRDASWTTPTRIATCHSTRSESNAGCPTGTALEEPNSGTDHANPDDPAPPFTAPLPNSLFRMLSGNLFTTNSFLYRREALSTIGPYDETLPVLGDWDFNIRFLRHYDVHVVDEPLAFYHHRVPDTPTMANTVTSPDLIHDRVRSGLLNRYLRQDLQAGKLGIGYLANALHADKEYQSLAIELLLHIRWLLRTAYREQDKQIGEIATDMSEVLEAAQSLNGNIGRLGGDDSLVGWRLAELDRHVGLLESLIRDRPLERDPRWLPGRRKT